MDRPRSFEINETIIDSAPCGCQFIADCGLCIQGSCVGCKQEGESPHPHSMWDSLSIVSCPDSWLQTLCPGRRQFRIADFPESQIRNPKSAIANPQSVHSYRRASMGSNLEALSAGYQPAPIPIAPANEKAIPMAEVDTSVGQPSELEMTWELKTPTPIPKTPPKTARTTASVRNWNWISPPVAPTDIRMPISRVRSVTDTSMMLITPMPPTIRLTKAMLPSSIVMTRLALLASSARSERLRTMKSLSSLAGMRWRCLSRPVICCSATEDAAWEMADTI